MLHCVFDGRRCHELSRKHVSAEVVSTPLCTVGVLLAWGLLLVVHHYDLSPEDSLYP